MDLLGGYSSGSDDSAEEPVLETAHASPARTATSPQPPADRGLLSALPPARESLTGSRKGPAALASKKPVLFRVPLDPSVLAESDEDEDRPAKRVKVDKAKGLMDMLPAPKHSAPARRHDSFARAQASKKTPAAAGPAAAAAPTAAALGNEAFRVPPPSHPGLASYPAASTDHQHASTTSQAATNGHDDYGEGQYSGHWQQQQPAGPVRSDWENAGGNDAGVGPAAGPVLDPMQEAYLAENVRGKSSGPGRDQSDPFADAGIKFVEVKGQDLREGSRAARDAQQGMRSALGPDYEARLRREAGPAPDRKSRGKHQITSLFHAAKMKELEQFDQRAQGMKTKAETQAKYGW